MILKSIGTWPFPMAKGERIPDKPWASSPAPHWVEISEEHWWYFLEVLPPRYFAGGFFVGEPASDDIRGVAIHAAVVKRAGRYFIREIPLDGTEKALHELEIELGKECLDWQAQDSGTEPIPSA